MCEGPEKTLIRLFVGFFFKLLPYLLTFLHISTFIMLIIFLYNNCLPRNININKSKNKNPSMYSILVIVLWKGNATDILG